MLNRTIVVALVFAAVAISDAHADNWGHWRGPSGNGIAENATPPSEWSDTKNVKWKVAIPGKGSGSPVIWGDKVFVVTSVAEGGDQAEIEQPPERRPGGQRGGRRGGRRSAPPVKTKFEIICFDRESGQRLWDAIAAESTPHQGVHSTNNFASASPCTDGEHVYAFFGSRGLYCYTMDGELKWDKSFGEMDTRNAFGEGASPTLAGDKIIVPWDHEGQSYLYALDKTSGDEIWKTKRDEPTNWSTPLVVEHEGKQQVVMNGQTKARSYDLESGKELWSCGGQTERPCASAVAIDDMVIVGSGHRGSFMGAFKLGGSGDVQGTDDVAWSIKQDTPDIASPLLSGGRLYFHKQKTGILTCLDAKTGKPHFGPSRIGGISTTYASPVAAGGYIFLTGRSGTTVVIKDAEELEIVATNSVGEAVDATPAPVGNELFVRGEKHLFCIAAE